MSDESHRPNPEGGRLLRPEEKALIAAMVADKVEAHDIIQQLPSYRVRDVNDGGMGSLRILPTGQDKRSFGRVLAEAQYVDEDDVVVSLAINLDDRGELYELDLWRVDFSPLKRFPTPEELRSKT
jgi:hypothetical protein